MEIPQDNRLLLRPSKLGTLGLLLLCSAFVAGGVWSGYEGKTMGWLTAAFFGLGIVVAIVHILPSASYLLLTENGLKARTLYRSWSVAWKDIAFFTTITIGHRMVVFNYADHYDKAKMTRGVARRIAGYEGALPDTYGMKADQLADLLNYWKATFEMRSRGTG
jgi:hypothetical protein